MTSSSGYWACVLTYVCPALWCTFFSLCTETPDSQNAWGGTIIYPGENQSWHRQYGVCAMAEARKDHLVQSQLDLSVELVRGSHEDPVSSNISSSVP